MARPSLGWPSSSRARCIEAGTGVKRSLTVTLLLSGALATSLGPAGCSQPDQPASVTDDGWDDQQPQDNNSYQPGAGYYHAPFHGWFPLPFNHYVGSRGYYYGGDWHPAPFANPPLRSVPSRSAATAVRSRVGRTGASGFAHSSAGSHVGSIARGGFGSTAHASAHS